MTGFQFLKPCLGGSSQDTHLNGVEHIFNALFTFFELFTQSRNGCVFFILQSNNRISDAVDFRVLQNPFNGRNHGDALNPVLFDSLAFTAQPALCAAALVVVILDAVCAASATFACHQPAAVSAEELGGE